MSGEIETWEYLVQEGTPGWAESRRDAGQARPGRLGTHHYA